jgi:hypothetical protein
VAFVIQTLAMPHAFPLIRAGGLFIFIMGIGVICGGVFPSQRRLFLILGAAGATVAITLLASALSRSLGTPTRIQIWALAAAIVLEMALIGGVVARYKAAGERTFLLLILFVVGLHFLPMAITFGPLCAILGVSAMANAGIGLQIKRETALKRIWILDGVLKIGFGSLMFSVSGVS